MSNSTLQRIPAFAFATRPKRGLELVDLDSFGFVRDIGGADESHGYNDSRDVLVTQSRDGVDYNQVWDEFQETITIQNAERQAIVDFLSFSVTDPFEQVSQLSSASFEEITEYGEPRGIRQAPKSFFLGYDLKFYDLAVRYTWQYLSNANVRQVEALHTSALDGDNRLVFTKVLEALYNNTNRDAVIDERPVPVYSLYNGTDGVVPPTYKSNVFDNTHSHYITSGAAVIEPQDLDDLSEHLRHHGYSQENGVQQIVAVNSREGKKIRSFRISEGATYDFIPSTAEATSLILEPGQQVSGGRPASSYAGLRVIGGYGEMLIVEDDLFVPGYVVIIGSGGRDNLANPVGIREHENPNLRGLRLVKGATPDYPLIDSFYMRGLGTGIRQRGGAAVMQITASATYSAPTQYVF